MESGLTLTDLAILRDELGDGVVRGRTPFNSDVLGRFPGSNDIACLDDHLDDHN